MSLSPQSVHQFDAHRDHVVNPASPRIHEGSWSDVEEAARSLNEPLLMPITPHADDRGWSLMNCMAGALSDQGQINYSCQHPGIVKAWHRHDRQTDFWLCVNGHLKAGVWREDDGASWMAVLGQMRPAVLVIPPPLWHGAACVGAEAAGLLYYVTERYNPEAPDEHRREWDSVSGFPWQPRHG
ncbi:MAG: hypothetical protein P8J86_10785 [Phycisphaerales bacterium]|nr:hypothetical protein [Phycisphaerales bacterium]